MLAIHILIPMQSQYLVNIIVLQLFFIVTVFVGFYDTFLMEGASNNIVSFH